MKKLLLFVIACTLGLFGTLRAQTVVEVGEGTETTNPHIPYNPYYDVSMAQQIYTADQINVSSGTITEISFRRYSGTTQAKNLDVYMINTTKSNFDSTTDWVALSEADIVFSGEYPYNGAQGWWSIVLDKPFEYTGGNILICLNNKKTTWDYTNNNYAFNTDDSRALYKSEDGPSAYDPANMTAAGTLLNKLNQIRFTFAATGEGGGEEPEPTPEPEQPGNDLIVTVGSGTEVEAFVPAQTGYDNTISQQIYLAEDFQGKTGKIKSYAFKCAKDLTSYGTPITVTRNFKVYMINTDKSSFTSKSDWAAVTESDLVFDGSVTFQPKDEWTVVTFDTPFEYEEGKNVLICINDASTWVSGSMNYYSHVTENVRSLVSYIDTYPYDATAITVESKFDDLNYVTQAQFEFVSEGGETPTPEPEPTVPAAPVVTVTPNGHNSLIFSWEPVEGATQYNVYSGTTLIAEITETTYTAGYLQAEQTYCFSISAVTPYGETELTEACGTTEAAPVAPAIPVVTYTTTETAITLTWEAVDGAETYNIYTPQSFDEHIYDLTETTYTFEGLTAGLEYCFLVSSVSALGYESDAADVCVTITAAPVEPEPEQPGEGGGEVVTIGSGDGTGDMTKFPLFTGYEYSLTQQIYTAEELAEVSEGTVINSIAFNVVGAWASTINRKFSIYLKSTSKTEFQAAEDSEGFKTTADFESIAATDLVYTTGEDGIVFDKEGWFTFTFDTPYTYTGGNLLLCVYDYSNNYAGGTEFSMNAAQTKKSIFLYDQNAISNPVNGAVDATNGWGAAVKGNNQIQLGFAGEGGGEEPDQPGGEELASEFSFDFEDGTLNGWRVFHGEGSTAADWANSEGESYFAGSDNSNSIYSMSGDGWTSWTSINNYIVTEKAYAITAESKLSWYVRHGWPSIASADMYEVVVSENGEDFQMIWEGYYDGTTSTQEISLAEYAGKNLYIGFRHYCVDADGGDAIILDNIVLSAGEGGGEEPTPEPEPTAPAAPQNVVATANGQNSIVVTWDAVEGAAYYIVYKDGQMWDQVNGTTYTSTGLTAGTEYCYAVQAYDANDLESELSEADCATTEAAPVAPAAPQNVVATANGQNSIIVTWNAVDGAAYYIVYKDGQMWDQVNGTTYTSTGLTAGTEYCYAVQAYDANDLESELSEADCATTESLLPELPENQVLVGEATTNYLTPFVTAVGNAWVEMIYKADEIGKAGRIAELAYSYNSGDEVTADINIYFAETTKLVFASPADATPVTDLELVYSGTGVTLCDSEWETFVLNTPFNYSGENNLLVVVSTSNLSATSQNYWKCYNDENTVLIKNVLLEKRKPVMLLTLAEGGEEGGDDTDPETPSTDNNRLVSVTQDSNWDNLTYVYESQTSNKVLRVLKGVDQGYGMYVTVLEYDENGVIIGSEYKWLENGALTNSNYIDEYEYTYTEGVLTSYTQTSGYDYYGTPTPVEYVLTHDANGNVETVVYGTNKVVYTYEDGKLVKEVMVYVMNGVEETEYEIDYAYENGNCISATQYSVLDGERIARKATEYFYDLTVEAEDVFSFAYPHEVKPASVNVLTKVLSYEYQEDYFSGAITKSNIKVLTYNYNFEVESVSFPPMGLSARAISDTEIELSWVATEETEKFAVYQNDTYIGESESTYFTVEGLTANTEYCFTVKGVNGEVESEASEAVCAKTMDVISVDPTTIAFGELRLGEYWSESEVTVGVNINRLGKTITSITCDDAFFTLPTDIDLTSEYIWFEMGYDKTAAAAGEYTATLTVTLESGVTVEIPVTATAYAPATPDVFELAQEVTFTEGVYTDTPNFATLHDDYAMPNENEWDETDAPDAVYSFTLEEESVVSVSVTGDNAAYAIFQAEGFEAPYEGNVFTGEVKNLNTEFVYNFDNNSLADFTIVDNDEYKDFTWAIEAGEKGYQLVSYSYYGWYAEDNSWAWINKADERLITNNAYPISAKSVLSFDMNVNGNFEEIIIEVTKDGESFTEIERITETSYSYDWLAKSVNVGEKFAELGLEYGDYQIVLYHKVDGYGELNIDNLVLAERVRTYPVGEYYLFAAAESAFTVEVNTTPAEDITFEPEIPVAKAYRLESIESFNVESYVYDEIYTNRVLSYVGSDGLDYILTYNKAGQLETVKSVFIIEGEEPQVISSIEYAYNEDGTMASYSESSPHPTTGAMFTTTTEYTYENGRLVKVENADYEVETTLVYNEDGTVKEIVESYMTTIMTYENGKLVKKAYGYEDEETGEFVTDAEDIYTYDANGNCVKQESYEYGKLYQVYEFYYDVKIAAEDVYSFELPHLAMTNVEPSSNNILVKKLSYYSYFDEEVGEVLTHSYDVTIYHYNPAVEMAPITPINLVAEVVDGVVELTWEKFIDAETFTVYQDGEILAQNVEEGAYTVEDLEAGEYCFAVRAYNKAGASATTEEVCVEIKESGDDPVAPEAPVVTPEATSDSTIVLTWAAVDGATNYNVYSADTLVANVTETTYTVTGLEAEKEYCFNVTAVNEVGGESAKSENACATTLKEGNEPTVLEAPVVQVVEITETTIVIAWNPVESATNYKVFANDQLITTLPDTIAGFRELTPNTEYCFTVVAINEVGESAPSEKVCATTKPDAIAENVAAFNIYPNPVADKLFIETEATVEEVTIYTLTGVMIYSEVDYNNNTINVSDLSGGVYFIKVRTDNGEVVKRFIKK